MNTYDSQKIVDTLKVLGFEQIDQPGHADIAILNTCHIREKAEQKVYSDLGRLREHQQQRRSEGKDLLIAVIGCVAQAEGEEVLRQAPYVSLVMGPQTYHKLPQAIAELYRTHDRRVGPGKGILEADFAPQQKFDALVPTQTTRYSAFLTVQEGCDKFCSFCCVPYTRGAEFSRPAQDLLKEARHLVAKGALEINLLGQNVNAYKGAAPRGKAYWNLGRLIYSLAEFDGLKRIRYTTSHPLDMHEELMQAHKDVPQLMPYLHLPVQSGSNYILKAMNRRHTQEQYLTIIERLKTFCPDIALSSDFIVGFPGEAEADFEATLELVKQVGYSQAYSFKYSPRPGTPAAMEENQVTEKLKSERLKVLQSLLDEQQLTFNQSKEGTIQEVLFERKGKQQGQWVGRTPYMQAVYVEDEKILEGSLVPVRLDKAHPHSLGGSLVNPHALETQSRVMYDNNSHRLPRV